jgi:hypothetical protein
MIYRSHGSLGHKLADGDATLLAEDSIPLILLTSHKIVDAVFGTTRKCRIFRSYSRTMRGLRFLSQNLLRTGNGDAGAAFPDNSLRGRSRPIMPADTQSE